MLKLLVRLTAFGIVVFLAVLSAMFLAADEDDFPQGTDHAARLDFAASPLSKAQTIAELGELVDRTGLRLERVVAGPEDFLTTRSVYVFGSAAPTSAEPTTWFRPGISGQRSPATELGDTTLDGTYVYAGSNEARAAFELWVTGSGAQASYGAKSAVVTLQYTLLTTGAWLSATTCLLLLVGLTVSWYVLRARARCVKVSCGAPTWRIVVEDYVSLLRVSLPPAAIALLSAFAVLCLTGRVSFILEFAQLILGFIEGMFAAMLLTALVISACTWPAVDGIASRRPPERHFRVISEALKAAALIIIALSLPAIGSGIASATQLSEQGARWAALDGQVSIRVRAGHPLNVPIGGNPAGSAPASDPLDRLDPLVAAAQAVGKLTFSYSERAADDAFVTNEGATGFGEFDGYAMVNPNYLAAVASLIGLTPTAERPLGDLAEEIDVDQLPRTLSRYFLDSYPLWNRDGRTLDGFAERFTFYRYVGPTSFPGLHPGLNRMDDLRNPVIVVIDDPSSTFTPQFLGSTLSSGNLIFSDADWVRDYLTHSPIGADILSIDRVSDSGLFSSQQAHQTAGVQAVSYALVVLALVASIAVSAWIHALARGRRTFVQRTAGWTWPRVLLARLGWEAALAVVVTGVVLGLGLSGGNPDMWWVVVVIPLYLAISGLMHLHAVRRVFTARVARVE